MALILYKFLSLQFSPYTPKIDSGLVQIQERMGPFCKFSMAKIQNTHVCRKLFWSDLYEIKYFLFCVFSVTSNGVYSLETSDLPRCETRKLPDWPKFHKKAAYHTCDRLWSG